MTDVGTKDQPESLDQESTWSSASKISRKVRELAHRSYHAMKAVRQPGPPASTGQQEIAGELRDLRHQVARLRQKIHARQLGALIPWVDALWKQVDGHGKRGEKTDSRSR